jgi:hypothetical protein
MGGELKLYGDDGWRGAPLLVVLHLKPSALPCAEQTSGHLTGRRHGGTGGSTPCSVAAFCHRPTDGAFASRCCDHFLVALHMHPFRLDGVHGILEVVHMQVWRADGVHLMFKSKKT